MSSNPVMKQVSQKMAKAVEYTLHEFDTVHTGKASPSMVESITVDAYGSMMRIKEVAAIMTPDSRSISIQPWDKSLLQAVSKAIQQANIGLTPLIDGNVVRCPIPELSGDRRQEMVKLTHSMAEEGRVRVRGARREGIDQLKKDEKKGVISEDDLKRLEKEIQVETDKYIADIGKHLEVKEKELKKV